MRLFKGTCTITAYFLSNEKDIDKLGEISKSVLKSRIDDYSLSEVAEFEFETIDSASELPIADTGKYVYKQSPYFCESEDQAGDFFDTSSKEI